MAPELFTDNGVFSFSSDIWGLGCILYEMATGKQAFPSNKLQTLINEVNTLTPARVPTFSDSFHDLLYKLLEKDPIKRISWEQL